MIRCTGARDAEAVPCTRRRGHKYEYECTCIARSTRQAGRAFKEKGQAALRLISRCKGKETQFIQVLVNKFQCKEAAMKAMITLGEAARSGANKEKLNEMRVQLYRDGAAVPEAVPAAAAVTEAAAASS